MKQLVKNRYPVFILVSLFVFIGCKTAFAPSYDKAIVTLANSSTTALLQLFSQVADGTVTTSFEKREASYDSIIGSFDALAIMTRARPVPSNTITKKIDAVLQQRNIPIVVDDYPSAVAFEQIVVALSKMKSKDRGSGLSKDAVGLFKGQIKVYLDQAITYESFLER